MRQTYQKMVRHFLGNISLYLLLNKKHTRFVWKRLMARPTSNFLAIKNFIASFSEIAIPSPKAFSEPRR